MTLQLAALLVPIVPGLLWMWIVYRTDRYEPEPKRLVLGTFVLGVLAIVPAFFVERLVDHFSPFLDALDRPGAAPDPLVAAAACFLVIGPCEELFKFLAVRLFIYRHSEFDEPLDGIVYSAAAALGFASLENVFYVVDFHHLTIAWQLLTVRSLLALPGHVIFAATWGYALGRKKFDAHYHVWPRLGGAALLHGLYDFLLALPSTRPLIALYMCLMVPIVWREIRILRSDSPFAVDEPDSND
jgi:RsiW-degrading membrane proteinase PrsW (M82 family)